MRIHFFILLSAFLFSLTYFGMGFYIGFLHIAPLFFFSFPVKSFRSSILPGLIMAFVLRGCDALWNLGNRGPLIRDLTELFKAQGIRAKDLSYNMIGTSRSGTCELHLSPDEVTRMVKSLNLKELKLENLSGENPWVKNPEPKKGCLTSKFFHGGKQVKGHLSGRRPPELRLKSGPAFEYFILFQDLETDKVCIQVSYAYG